MSDVSWIIDRYRISFERIGDEMHLNIDIVDDRQKRIPPDDAEALRSFICHAIQDPQLKFLLASQKKETIFDAFEEYIDDNDLTFAAIIHHRCDGCGDYSSWREGEVEQIKRIDSGQMLCQRCIHELSL